MRAVTPRRLIAVFEPRSNTSRRAVFQSDYARAFGDADQVVVAEVQPAPIYSATGEVTERFSSERLARDLRGQGAEAVAIDGVDAIVDHLFRVHAPGDVRHHAQQRTPSALYLGEATRSTCHSERIL
jgi:UDP-N-acetylmuramate: L-alanyl-gamma-D-glutamyl-meso-diaminopimelate ligase